MHYSPVELIDKIMSPKLFIHSREDETVPFVHGVTLYDKAKEPKTFVEIRGSHGSGFLDSGRDYIVPLQSFLRKVEQSLVP